MGAFFNVPSPSLIRFFAFVVSTPPTITLGVTSFYESVSDKVDPSVPTLLVGGFNSVFDRSLDRRGSNPSDSSRESSVRLRALFYACCIVDI